MDRGLIYPGQVPLETDLLFAQKSTMVGLGKLAAAMLGTGTLVNGFAVTPNSPAALNVLVGPGEIYALANIDATAYSSIAADTTHSIVKQGISLDQVTLACAAPGTAGFSVNYLIQATFSEVDGTPVVLPYYNASNPATAYSGPSGTGTAQNTRRSGTVVLSAKGGTAAATGTQTTPAPDAGYVGVAVVTVANGQTTITSGNITALATSSTPAGGMLVGGIQNAGPITSAAGGTADALTGSYAPAIASLINGMTLYVRATSINATATPTFTPNNGVITPKTIVKGASSALVPGDIAGGGHWCEFQYDLTLDKWVLLNPATGVSQTAVGSAPQAAFTNWKADAIGVNNYNVVISADSVVLKNSSGQPYTATAVSKTINANGTVGAPLSIMSARAASTWYYIWLWYNGTAGLTATLDVSKTAPTVPTGYASTDYKASPPGAVRTDASGSTYLLQTSTRDFETIYVVLAGSNTPNSPLIGSGVQGTYSATAPVWAALAVGSFVPPTASRIRGRVDNGYNGAGVSAYMLAPNNSYSGSSTTNPCPVYSNGSSVGSFSVMFDFALESTNIYAAANGGFGCGCLGWKDNI